MVEGRLHIAPVPERYVGGAIQRLDLKSGAITTLYTACDGAPLIAPNDLAFDGSGGLWFTDHGVNAPGRTIAGGIYHALADGGAIRCVRRGLRSPNGIGFSPDGRWLYWADTLSAELWRAPVAGPGALAGGDERVGALPVGALLDSLAVQADGRVCVGVIGDGGGIAIFDPAKGSVVRVAVADDTVTNLAFGGADGRDVWVTAARTGRLLRGRWASPGAPPAFTG